MLPVYVSISRRVRPLSAPRLERPRSTELRSRRLSRRVTICLVTLLLGPGVLGAQETPEPPEWYRGWTLHVLTVDSALISGRLEDVRPGTILLRSSTSTETTEIKRPEIRMAWREDGSYAFEGTLLGGAIGFAIGLAEQREITRNRSLDDPADLRSVVGLVIGSAIGSVLGSLKRKLRSVPLGPGGMT